MSSISLKIRNLTQRTILKSTDRKRFYYSIVFKMILAICTAALLAGVVVIQILSRNEMSRANQESKTTIRVMANNLDDVLYTLEKQSFLLTQSNNTKEILERSHFSEDIPLSLNMANELMLYKNNNDAIDEIYLYDVAMLGVFSNRFGYRDSRSDHYRESLYLIGLSRPAGWCYPPGMDQETHVAYYRKLPMLAKEPKGLLVFYVKKQMLYSYLMGFSSNKGGALFVLDNDDGVILGIDNLDESPTEPLSAFLSEMLPEPLREEEPRVSVVNVHGKDYLVAQMKKFSGKTYLSILEKSRVVDNVTRVILPVLGVILFTICGGIGFAVLYSRQLYSPVRDLVLRGRALGVPDAKYSNEILYIGDCFDQLNQETQALQQYASQINTKMRADFLMRLLFGTTAPSQDVLDECRAHSIPTDCQYAVMVFCTEDGPHSGGPERLIESLSCVSRRNQFPRDLLVRNKNNLILVGYFPPDADKKAILDVCSAFSQEVLDLFGKGVRVGVGTVRQHLSKLSSSYRDAMFSANECILDDEGRRIFVSSDTPKHKPGNISVVHESARCMAEWIEEGKVDRLHQEFERFVQASIESGSGSYAFQMFSMLLADILFLVDHRSDISASELLEQEVFFHLDECQTVDEARSWFVNSLFPGIMKQKRLVNKQDEAIPVVCRYIRESIRGDITLAGCAEIVNLSPSYLSKLFKREVGMSFLEYVLKHKLDVVKAMLLDTDMSISDIAGQIGYSPRSLYRQFYKQTALSPNEFRKAGQETGTGR
jgi:AraC-like DNA-binding protein